MKDLNAFGMKGIKSLIEQLVSKYGLSLGMAENEFQKLDPAPIKDPQQPSAKEVTGYTGSRHSGDGRINPDPNAWKKQGASTAQAPAIPRQPMKDPQALAVPTQKDLAAPMAAIEWNRAHENPDEKVMQSLSGLLSARQNSGETGNLKMLPFQVPVKNKFIIPKLKKA